MAMTREQNEELTLTGPGTLMGDLLRRYWVPALHDWELPEPDCPPVRVKLLGESLIAFRDTQNRIGLIDRTTSGSNDRNSGSMVADRPWRGAWARSSSDR